jgi:serine/threonine-protein kinase
MTTPTGNPLFSAEHWSAVRHLLDTLSHLSPEHQARELERIAADDADLAASARALLDGMSATTTPSVQSVFERLLPAETMPASIGPFRLLERIGSGGMGVVYRAERSGADFTQRVAIKLLDGDAARMSRLAARERRILAALAHPNITAFIDAGNENGRAWLAMEYVDGEPLNQYCLHHSLDVRERVRLFDQVCAAVAHAHSQLVVHRDLKPSNVLVAADGSAKLLDFGIALVLDPSDEQTPATRAFTPEYAAPEQLRGERATTATDVYGLGLMLYELVCGKRLPTLEHRGDDAGWTTAELARRAAPMAAADAQAASTPRGEAKALSRLLRGDLGRIIAHALAPKPTQRYASVALLREDLARWLDHRPLTLARPGLAYTVGRFVRRHRVGVAVAVLGLIAILGLSAAAVWQAHEKTLEAARARAQTARAEAIQQFLGSIIDQANPDRNGGKPITAHDLIEKGEQQVGSFDRQPALQADVLSALGKAYIGVSDYARAKILLDQAQGLLATPDIPDDVRARVLAGVAEFEVGNAKFDAALAHAQQGLALLEADPGANQKEIAAQHMHIAQALDGLGDAAKTEAFLRTSIPRDRAAIGDNDKSVAEQWVLLGWTLGQLDRFEEAEQAFHNGIAGYRGAYGESSYDEGHALNDLGLVLQRKNDLAGAEKAARESVRIRLATVGPDHRATLGAQHNLLVTMELRGHFDEALPEREKLLEHASRPGLLTPRQLAGHYQVLGVDYAELGRFDEAETALRRSLTLGEQAQGPRNLPDQPARRELGVAQTLSGQYDDAERTLRETLAIQLEHDPPTALKVKTLQALLGDLMRLRHRYAEALALLTEATTLSSPLKDNNTWWPIALARLSDAQLDTGDATAAAVTAQRALDYAHKAFTPDHYKIGFALYALARADLARGRAAHAEPLLREALKVRSPPHPATHPRVLEVEAALVQALAAQGKHEQAHTLAAEIRPRLQASSTPYAADLLARLGTL